MSPGLSMVISGDPYSVTRLSMLDPYSVTRLSVLDPYSTCHQARLWLSVLDPYSTCHQARCLIRTVRVTRHVA